MPFWKTNYLYLLQGCFTVFLLVLNVSGKTKHTCKWTQTHTNTFFLLESEDRVSNYFKKNFNYYKSILFSVCVIHLCFLFCKLSSAYVWLSNCIFSFCLFYEVKNHINNSLLGSSKGPTASQTKHVQKLKSLFFVSVCYPFSEFDCFREQFLQLFLFAVWSGMSSPPPLLHESPSISCHFYFWS